MRTLVLSLSLLAIAALPSLANDDPEPPGRALDARQLEGKWNRIRSFFEGADQKQEIASSYAFVGNRFTYEAGGGKVSYGGKYEIDPKKRPQTLELTTDDGRGKIRFVAKIEKGELYLSLAPGIESGDFSGKTSRVMILAKEKK